MTSVRIRWVFVAALGIATMLTGCAGVDTVRTGQDAVFSSEAATSPVERQAP